MYPASEYYVLGSNLTVLSRASAPLLLLEQPYGSSFGRDFEQKKFWAASASEDDGRQRDGQEDETTDDRRTRNDRPRGHRGHAAATLSFVWAV